MKTHIIILAAALLTLPAVAQLTGTYTVGGASPDYVTLTAAVNALNTQGATGNVVFDIRPGTYTGQYTLAEITGTPESITFKKAGTSAQPVNLEYDAVSDNDNFIFQLNGTDGVRFEGLTFRPLDTYYETSIEFFNECQILQVIGCTFMGSFGTEGPGHLYRIAVHCDQLGQSTNDNPQDIMIMDNTFIGGYTGIDLYFYSFSGTRSHGLIIADNTFIDQVGTGISVNNAVGQISDNVLSATRGDWYTGIRTAFFDNGSQISRNTVTAIATLDCTGIEVSNTQNTAGNMISNNMVYVSGTTAVWGIAVFNLWDMKIVHNSVLLASGDPEVSHAFYHLSNFTDGEDALVRNNIFANSAGGAAYTIDQPTNIAIEDHNALYSSGAVLSKLGTTEYATLAAHQAGTGLGSGDIDTDPVFPAQPDLHMNNCAMDNAGEYFFVVGSDIDGDAHGNPVCDIGADEYTANTNVVQGPAILVGADELPYQLGLNATFAAYTWNTGASTPTIPITSGGTYTCNVTDVNGCSYTVSVAVTVDFTTSIVEEEASTMHAYPNPAVNELWITGLQGNAPYRLIDVSGKIVAQGIATNGSSLAIDALPEGLYIIHVENSTLRFMKTN